MLKKDDFIFYIMCYVSKSKTNFKNSQNVFPTLVMSEQADNMGLII